MTPLLILYNHEGTPHDRLWQDLGFQAMCRMDVVLVVDKGNKVTVLKNRWGKDDVQLDIPNELLNIIKDPQEGAGKI